MKLTPSEENRSEAAGARMKYHEVSAISKDEAILIPGPKHGVARG